MFASDFYHLNSGSIPEKAECLKCFLRVNWGRGISAQGSESKFESV